MVAESMFTEDGRRGYGGTSPQDTDGGLPLSPDFTDDALVRHAHRVREPVHLVREQATGRMGLAPGGSEAARTGPGADGRYRVLGTLPPLYPEWLGDPGFRAGHGVRFPYARPAGRHRSRPASDAGDPVPHRGPWRMGGP